MALPITPESFLKGFGMRGTCEVTDAYFTPFDYNGKSKSGFQPTLLVHYKDESGQEAKYPEPYTAGSFAAMAPSADGVFPIMAEEHPSGYGTGPFLAKVKENVLGVYEDQNFAFFITALVNAGFPAARLKASDGDIRCIIGTVAEFGSVEKKYIDKSGKEGSTPVSVPLHVLKLPGEKGKGVKTGAKPAATQSAAAIAASNGTAHDELASNALLAALAESDGALEVKSIPPKILKQLINLPAKDRSPVAIRAKDPGFLNQLAEDGKILYDEAGGMVVLVA